LIDRFSFASGAEYSLHLKTLLRISSLYKIDVVVELKKMDGMAIAEGASVPALGLLFRCIT